MTMTLDQARIGEHVRVTGFAATEAQFRRKLLALGVVPGAEIEIRRVAPLGDPIQIQLRGTSVSLRKQEATILLVESIT
ncbi:MULTISPECIES: FeoA family protein [Oceanospirillaceae]|jgi:ferrous iron transport protein A|uniref:FeoA family protein n=1 Tax=Oceanobacter antarcticus TaxID=3133425 RepID=A0ABW8NNT5_9GAMM|tara:strand:+ start:24991 stop:25227 length:237 start_codon:yes stop_codon:yes gene_type:complete